MSLDTLDPAGDEAGRVQERLRSNQSAHAEPWPLVGSPTPRGRAYSVSRPSLQVPEATRNGTHGERFPSRRRSGSSASPIESDRRTVVTVEDPLSDSDSAYDRDSDTDKEQDADEGPATTSDDHCIIKRTQQELRSGLRNSKHKSRRWFIPYDKLRDILTKRRVRNILLQTATFQPKPLETLDVIAGSICTRVRKPNGRRTGYIRIFAILVLMNQIKYIEDFLNEFITDADLPLRESPNDSPGENLVMRNSDDDDCDQPLRCFEKWKPEHMDSFIAQQERLISPRFRMRGDQLCLHRLRSNIILPFIECGDKAFFGGFGRVSKVKIHPAHCDFDPRTLPHASNLYGASFDSQNNRHTEHDFALKEIQSDDYTLFRAEVGVHEKFSASRKGHEHLIRLLAAIEHGTNYYLLFPWAQGTLVDLWQRVHASPESPDDVEWLIKQCLGIADGLQRIHQYKSSWTRNDQDRERSLSKNKGTHGDVKAENILFFDPLEEDTLLGNKHLVVSDFGLTRFREESQASDPHGWSRTYRAPELDMNHGTSRKYDVWSLGCLFLEFTSWFLLGFDATRSRLNMEIGSPKSFQDVRIENDEPFGTPFKEDKFFNLIQAPGIGNTHAVVKSSVIEWMNKLRLRSECSEPIRDFLDLIQFDMLVPDKETRKSMNDVRDGLRKIYSQARFSGGFSFPDVLLHTDQADVSEQSVIDQSLKDPYQLQLGMSGSLHGSTTEPYATANFSPIDHSRKLIEELAKIDVSSMVDPDAGKTTTSSSADVVHRYPDQEDTLRHSLYHDDEQPNIFHHENDDGLHMDRNVSRKHHALLAPESRIGASRIILFTSPNSEGILPYITATASSTEVLRRNSTVSVSLASTIDSSEDDACFESSSCQEKGNSDHKQLSKDTPLPLPPDELLHRDQLSSCHDESGIERRCQRICAGKGWLFILMASSVMWLLFSTQGSWLRL